MDIRTVLDAAQAIAAALGVRFGDITISVSDDGVSLLRMGQVLKPEDLAEMPLRGVESEP